MADEADGMLRECLRHYTAYQLGTFFLLQAKADNRQDACIKELAGYKSLLRYHGGHKKLIVLSFLCKVVGKEAGHDRIDGIHPGIQSR